MKSAIDEAHRWLTHAQDEYQDAEDLRERGRFYPTRYPNGLPGGVPSRFYTDPEEAAEASALARQVIEAVAQRLGEQK